MIFSRFGKNKTSCIVKMRESLQSLMLQYIKNHTADSDFLIPIFSDAEVMIRKTPEREMSQLLADSGINFEAAMLNILQNHAMARIKPLSPVGFLSSRTEDPALMLYNDVNKMKLDKGYITQKQFEDNEILGVQIAASIPGL